MRFFIDAGHNDACHDTGAAALGLREQDITWQIAEYVAENLLAMGQQVKLSRPKKTDILGTDLNTSLSARANMSDQFGADYCISIHCNAGGGTGVEVYTYTQKSLAAKMAEAVDKKIAQQLQLKDRGVKTANFYMLRAPKAPAILIETAFIDTAYDNNLLKTKQKEFAQAITDGISEAVGLKQEVNMNPSDAIRKLHEAGVINTPDYWEAAVEVVNYLGDLLINMAKKI